jgi:hypothetical protein
MPAVDETGFDIIAPIRKAENSYRVKRIQSLRTEIGRIDHANDIENILAT